MFPIATNLKLIRTPWATYIIVGTNVVIHLVATWNTHWHIPDETAHGFGFVPARFGEISTFFTLVTCTFLHGDLFHLSGNMLFLLVFGRQMETDFGTINFLAFYFTAGLSACLAHAIVESNSSTPLVGASGAISGVLGAFFICNPKARVTLVLEPVLIYFLRRLTIPLPARIFLLVWFFLQISLALKSQSSNVAFWAHVVGFLVGTTTGIAVYRYMPGQEVVKNPH